MPTLTATYYDRAAADEAVRQLLAEGVSPDDISLLVSNSTRERYFQHHDGGLESNAARGAAIGGGLGAIAGGLVLGGVITAATGGLALPFLVAGPLGAALTGVIGGTAVGTIVGGLTGAGVSEPVAHNIDEGVRQGALVVAVHIADDTASGRVGAILNHTGETLVPPADAVPPLPGTHRNPDRQLT
jgi:hypothetical protein